MATRKKKLALSPPERLEDRLAPAGGLDVAFDGDGLRTLNFDSNNTDVARAVKVQNDGNIVAVGSWDGGRSDFAIARFTPDGMPDPEFGAGFFDPGSGKANVFFGNSIGSGYEVANAVAVQNDGKIVVAGYTNLNGGGPSAANDFAIARLDTNGKLDPTFGNGGKVTFDFSPQASLPSDDRATAVVVQDDGMIVAAGSSEFGGLARFTFVRLKPDGSLDDTFGTGGKRFVQVGDTSTADFATGLAYQRDDKKIVAVGYTDQDATGVNPNNFAVVRLTELGGLDDTFDGDGKKVVDFGSDDRANAVAIQPDGAIVVVGSRGVGLSDFAVARLTGEGFTDITFGGGDGQQTVTFASSAGTDLTFDYANGVAVQPNGRIVVGGYSTPNAVGATADFAAARLTKIGEPDPTFGDNGRQTADVGGPDVANGVALQPDGRVVLAGSNGPDFAIARLKGDEADLSVTVTNGVSSVTAGGTVEYTITVSNTGPDRVEYDRFGTTLPPQFAGQVSYDSEVIGGAIADPGSGDTAIIDRLILPPGGVVTYTLTGVVSPTATGTLQLAAAVFPQGYLDANAANNVAGDSDPIAAPQPGNFTFSAPTYTVAETGTTATITVNRVGGSDGPVSVRYRARNGTATAGSDYVATNGILNWADGDTAQTFTIPITDDTLSEGSETIELSLDDPSPGSGLVAPFNAVLTITDNDPPPTIPPTVPPTVPPTIPPTVPPTVPPTIPPTVPPTIPPTAPPTVPPTIPPIVPPTIPPTVPPTIPPVVPPTVPPAVLVGTREFAVGADGRSGEVRFYNPDASLRFSISPFGSFSGGVRTAAADFNGDGVADLVVGTGPGAATQVLVLDGKTQAQLFAVAPFEASFTGGVYVAAGDLTGDGTPELVITPDEGGGPRVRVFNGSEFGLLADFFGIDDPNFRGGARAAVGDVNGDGTGDLVVAAGFQGGPRVAGFSGKSLASGPVKVFGDFFAFEQTLRNGVYIAAGDIDGDGFAEVIAGGGPGGGPRVTAVSGQALLDNVLQPVANFFGGGDTNRGGVRLAVKNLDGDARADLIVGAGTAAGDQVTGYLGKTVSPTGTPPAAFSFDAFPGFDGGVFVG